MMQVVWLPSGKMISTTQHTDHTEQGSAYIDHEWGSDVTDVEQGFVYVDHARRSDVTDVRNNENYGNPCGTPLAHQSDTSLPHVVCSRKGCIVNG